MKTWMKQRPLVSFFVLAYLLSWLLWVPLAIVFNGPTEPPEEFLLLLFVGIYGASGAGLIMTRVVEGKGSIRKLLRRYLDWRVGFQWFYLSFCSVLLAFPANQIKPKLANRPTPVWTRSQG